jgi:hypothetical protein
LTSQSLPTLTHMTQLPHYHIHMYVCHAQFSHLYFQIHSNLFTFKASKVSIPIFNMVTIQ